MSSFSVNVNGRILTGILSFLLSEYHVHQFSPFIPITSRNNVWPSGARIGSRCLQSSRHDVELGASGGWPEFFRISPFDSFACDKSLKKTEQKQNNMQNIVKPPTFFFFFTTTARPLLPFYHIFMSVFAPFPQPFTDSPYLDKL